MAWRRLFAESAATRRLDRARELAAIDEASLDLSSAAAAADLIVLCTPVDRIAEQVVALVPHCRPGTLITDVGSTKGTIVQAVEDYFTSSPAGDEVHFIGSHPLAGSEKQGPQHADADLFQNRWTIVTRTARTDVTALDRVMTFWQELGAASAGRWTRRARSRSGDDEPSAASARRGLGGNSADGME